MEAWKDLKKYRERRKDIKKWWKEYQQQSPAQTNPVSILPDGSAASAQTSPERTYGGALRQKDTVRKIDTTLGTEVTYGEKTWTTAQTFRDLLQNHLDAETQKYFDEIIASVVDTSNLSDGNNFQQSDFDNFTYALFLFKKGLGDFSPATEKELVKEISNYLFGLPIKPEFLGLDGKLSLEAIKSALEPLHETFPELTYIVADTTLPKNRPEHEEQARQIGVPVEKIPRERQLSLQEFMEPQFREEVQIGDKKQYRYEIVGVKIADEGSGFDAKLSSLYASTKTGRSHLRGKFGEGTKMSTAHLLRHGATIKMRSKYRVHTSGDDVSQLWQHKAYVGEDAVIRQKGIEVDTAEQLNTGSYTLLRFDKADETLQQELRAVVDPRKKEGLGANCLEYSSTKFHYPILRISGNTIESTGVCIDADKPEIFLKGLKISDGRDQMVSPLFSYDFSDSNLLLGRDRNALQGKIKQNIARFWSEVDSPELAKALVEELAYRVIPNRGDGHVPELAVLDRILETDVQKASEKRRRVLNTFLDIFPKATNAKPGVQNILVNPEEYQKNKSFLNDLEREGNHIIIINADFTTRAINNLHERYSRDFAFTTLPALRLEQATKEVTVSPECALQAESLLQSAHAQVAFLAERAGYSIADFNIDLTPHYRDRQAQEGTHLFDLEFHEGKQTFEVVFHTATLRKVGETPEATDYWQKRLAADIVATYNRTKEFPDNNSKLIASQENAQYILDRSAMAIGNVIPSDFRYLATGTDFLELLQRSFHEERQNEESLRGMSIYQEATNLNLSFADMERLVKEVGTLVEPYKEQIKEILSKRVLVEGDSIGYVDYTLELANTVNFVQVDRNTLPIIEMVGGQPLYQLNDKLFLYNPFSNGTVVINNDKYLPKKYVFADNRLLEFGTHSFGPSRFNQVVPLQRDGLSIRTVSFPSIEDATIQVKEEYAKLVISLPEKNINKEMNFLQGTVETPITTEYGKDEWNNPIRVFQDIIQNHLDASPYRNVEQAFEVERSEGRVFISENELTADDKIVGYRVSDNGDGYAPNKIGIMGNSSKKSPLFSGKYGEGQKMIAAAAVRNRLELTYTSVASYDGKPERWEGAAASRDETVIVDGVQKPLDKVIFNVAHNDTAESYTSATILRQPAGGDNKLWQDWLEVIDPRKKNEYGEKGIARYVLPLQEKRNGIIDMGYMKILLDRPGEVYENGLLVESGYHTLLGYDVPEVVKTRERNAVDRNRLKQYIVNAIDVCADPRLAETVVNMFKQKYLTQVAGNKVRSIIPEDDVDFLGMPSNHFWGFMPARPLFRQAVGKALPGYMAYSEPALKARIERDQDSLKRYVFSPQEKQLLKAQIVSAQHALSGVAHIPTDKLIFADTSDTYATLQKFFPTVEELTAKLAVQEIPASESVRNMLQDIVSSAHRAISATEQELRQDAGGELTYKGIVTQRVPNEVSNSEFANTQASRLLQERYWEREELKHHAERVFVAPAQAGYLGIAAPERIGVNERSLSYDKRDELAGTAIHELVHKRYGLSDYSTEFIMMLLEIAKYNLGAASPAETQPA